MPQPSGLAADVMQAMSYTLFSGGKELDQFFA